MRIEVVSESWPLLKAFHTSNHTFEDVEVVVVTVEHSGQRGLGEAAGVYYRGETVESMLKEIDDVRSTLEHGFTHESLLQLLPAGGARNAIDCALWDLEAKLAGRPVWQLAGLPEPKPLRTFVTCGADTPQAMATAAAQLAGVSSIKLKLVGDVDDAERVILVRAACPEATLCVDANQAFDRALLRTLLPALERAGVMLIEQAFPRGCEAWATEFQGVIPMMADESAETSLDLQRLRGGFGTVNLKLDKCGGLTEAIRMARAARKIGMKTYVGNMFGTSIAMAPAFLLGQICDFVELDGPLFLKKDRIEPMTFQQGMVKSGANRWGGVR